MVAVVRAGACGIVAVLFPHIGLRLNGSRRWIGLGPLTFQPSELAKLAAILSSLPGLLDAKKQGGMFSTDLFCHLQSLASRRDLFWQKSIWERQLCWEQPRSSSCLLQERIHYGSE